MNWSSFHPMLVGAVTFLLMWTDWLLTVLQEREKRTRHDTHYRSYPVDTTEGSPLLQRAVSEAKLIDMRHALTAAVVSIVVALAFMIISDAWRPIFLGYVWGMFLVVDTAHLSNLLGYLASRRGLHGRLYMHQRTGYLVQAGRHFALAVLLIILAVTSESLFVTGVAVAGMTLAARQLLWLRRLPAYDEDNDPPGEVSMHSDAEGNAPTGKAT